MSRPAEVTDVADAVEHALRAPSVYNTQPWRWRIRPAAVELHADWDRHLPATDPDGRDLVVSCGAALHHVRVVLAARGLAVQVDRLPDPENSAHLATISIRPGTGDPIDAALVSAIDHRRTDRRRMSHRPVPGTHLQALADQAQWAGALLSPMNDAAMRQRLSNALTEAARSQEASPGYAAELDLWTSRYAGGRDGIPAGNVPPSPIGLVGPSPLRRFPRQRLEQPRQRAGQGPADDAAELLVLATRGDDQLDWLRAGEATSAVLLAATRLGLATTPLSQAVEVDSTRRAIRQEVLDVFGDPQLILRVGWPATGAAELPATPRRDVRSVLLTS
jgi:nitroreductase